MRFYGTLLVCALLIGIALSHEHEEKHHHHKRHHARSLGHNHHHHDENRQLHHQRRAHHHHRHHGQARDDGEGDGEEIFWKVIIGSYQMQKCDKFRVIYVAEKNMMLVNPSGNGQLGAVFNKTSAFILDKSSNKFTVVNSTLDGASLFGKNNTKAVCDEVKQFLADNGDGLSSSTDKVGTFLLSQIGTVPQVAQQFGGLLSTAVKNGTGGAIDPGKIADIIFKPFTNVDDAMKEVRDTISNNAFGDLFNGAFQGIGKFFQQITNTTAGWIKNVPVLGTIANGTSQMFDNFTKGIGDLGKGVSNIFGIGGGDNNKKDDNEDKKPDEDNESSGGDDVAAATNGTDTTNTAGKEEDSAASSPNKEGAEAGPDAPAAGAANNTQESAPPAPEKQQRAHNLHHHQHHNRRHHNKQHQRHLNHHNNKNHHQKRQHHFNPED